MYIGEKLFYLSDKLILDEIERRPETVHTLNFMIAEHELPVKCQSFPLPFINIV